MNSRWLMRETMSLHNCFNSDAMMEKAAQLGPTAETPEKAPLVPVQPEQRLGGLTVRCRPRGRPLSILLKQALIGMTDVDGLPGPNVAFNQEIAVGYVDPEGRGRSIGQQVDDLLEQMKLQSEAEMEERRASG